MFKVDGLKREIYNTRGILFCFGKSFISKIIQAKTRLTPEEIVPSHVAIVYNNCIYESTTEVVKVNGKTIPSGVRRWLISDYIKAETRKSTEYEFIKLESGDIDIPTLEGYIHYPYGKDTIIDYLLTDGSDGVSDGLICSQYANKVTNLIDKDCPSPAELFRHCRKLEDAK